MQGVGMVAIISTLRSEVVVYLEGDQVHTIQSGTHSCNPQIFLIVLNKGKNPHNLSVVLFEKFIHILTTSGLLIQSGKPAII